MLFRIFIELMTAFVDLYIATLIPNPLIFLSVFLLPLNVFIVLFSLKIILVLFSFCHSESISCSMKASLLNKSYTAHRISILWIIKSIIKLPLNQIMVLTCHPTVLTISFLTWSHLIVTCADNINGVYLGLTHAT